MTHVIIFSASGSLITLLLIAKAWELKRKKPNLILRTISYGDSYIKGFHHELLQTYAASKDNISFLTKKQIPIRSKNFLNKSVGYLKEKRNQYIGDVRDSRLLRKPEGISEFIKSMSDIEKGNGEINETFTGSSQEVQNKVK